MEITISVVDSQWLLMLLSHDVYVVPERWRPLGTRKIRVTPTFLVPYMIVELVSKISVSIQAEALLLAWLSDFKFCTAFSLIILSTIIQTEMYPNWYRIEVFEQ